MACVSCDGIAANSVVAKRDTLAASERKRYTAMTMTNAHCLVPGLGNNFWLSQTCMDPSCLSALLALQGLQVHDRRGVLPMGNDQFILLLQAGKHVFRHRSFRLRSEAAEAGLLTN